MYKIPVNTLIIGFTKVQHEALIKDFAKVDQAVRANTDSLSVSDFKSALQASAIHIVFIQHQARVNLAALHRVLKRNNPDCIVVELLELPDSIDALVLPEGLQSCQVIYDRSRPEFLLALHFIVQYTRLKIEFRRCKSLLYLSERRSAKLVNTSSVAIAYLAKGKILHANIPFLVLFGAESVEEIKRFSLLRLIDEAEREVFASYLSEVKQSPYLNADLHLNMKRTSGAPFSATVSISPMVLKGVRCYQIWVEPKVVTAAEDVIPVTQSLDVWGVPVEPEETLQVNPFDEVLTPTEPVESNAEVMLNALRGDDAVSLQYRDLHQVDSGALGQVWVTLSIAPDEFKKINALLAKVTGSTTQSMVYGSFWDRLLFLMLFDALSKESALERVYLVELSKNMIADAASIVWLAKALKSLGQKTVQLVLLVDAQIPMNRIPQTQKAIELLRSRGVCIALNHFSVDTTPLFLYRRVQPEWVVLDEPWLEALKQRPDGQAFLARFVQQVEAKGGVVIIPQTPQAQSDKLLILPSSSFGQENSTQDCV